MVQAAKIELFTSKFKANPYPAYAELRATQPVYRTQLPAGDVLWLITRYDDVLAV